MTSSTTIWKFYTFSLLVFVLVDVSANCILQMQTSFFKGCAQDFKIRWLSYLTFCQSRSRKVQVGLGTVPTVRANSLPAASCGFKQQLKQQQQQWNIRTSFFFLKGKQGCWWWICPRPTLVLVFFTARSGTQQVLRNQRHSHALSIHTPSFYSYESDLWF